MDSIRKDDSYVRIHYTRYADDFVIGIIGSHTLAQEVLEKIRKFVSEHLKLTFNPDKTGIVDLQRNSFNFLGFTIHAPISKKGVKSLETITVNGRTITRRRKTRPIVNMDTEKVLKKLANNGFIRKRISHTNHQELMHRGTFKGNLINLDHPDILMYYNSVLRGLQNYYAIAKNRTDVTWVG